MQWKLKGSSYCALFSVNVLELMPRSYELNNNCINLNVSLFSMKSHPRIGCHDYSAWYYPAKERSRACTRGLEREKELRMKECDTVMTQTSCILVPHKAAGCGRACVTHARMFMGDICDHTRHGLFIMLPCPLVFSSCLSESPCWTI